MQHGIPVGELDIISLNFAQDFRREDEQEDNDLQRVGDLNADGAFNEAGQGKEEQGEHTQEHVFKVMVEDLRHQRHNHQSAEGDVHGRQTRLGLDLLPQRGSVGRARGLFPPHRPSSPAPPARGSCSAARARYLSASCSRSSSSSARRSRFTLAGEPITRLPGGITAP